MRTATCDPFVRVALSRPGSLALAEAETRVLTRNRFPLWEECLPFPLDEVTEDVCMTLRVMDKDIGHFNSFIGMASLPIKDVLLAITELGQEHVYRLPLQDRQGKAARRGELVFAVSILTKQQCRELRSGLLAVQDPDKVHAQLGGHRLHMRLQGLRDLGGLAGAAGLTAEVSLCSFEERRPLVFSASAPVFPSASPSPSASPAKDGSQPQPQPQPQQPQLAPVDVVVPLSAAFAEGGELRGKARSQFGEVKVSLYLDKTRIAKTQVPIWDVPFRADSPPSPPASPPPPPPAAAAAAAAASAPAASAAAASAAAADGDARSGDGGSFGGDASPEQAKKCCKHLRNLASAVVGAAGVAAAGVAVARRKPDIGAAVAAPSAAPAPAADAPASPAPAAPAPAAPASPLWAGRMYERRMETARSRPPPPWQQQAALSSPPLLTVSMQLVKVESDSSVRSGGSGGAAAAADLAAADVDSPESSLVAPPQLPTHIADFTVGLGPHALFRTMYGNGAELADRVAAAEQLTDLRTDPWVADPEGRALLVRGQTYKKPTPVGPTPAEVRQKLLVKHDGGFVVEQRVTPSVPGAGRCVHVFMQVVGQHAGPGRTRLTVTLKMEWFKSGMMVSALKGKIEDASPKDARKWFATVRRELAAKVLVEDAAGGGAPGGSGAVGAAASADAAAAGAAAGTGAGAGVLGAGGSAAVAVLAAVAVVLLLLVLLALVRVGSALGRNAAALEGLTAALTAAPAAAQQVCAAAAAAAAVERGLAVPR